jgi:CheY-like chemotaxis protein
MACILIVDDDLVIRKQLRVWLEDAGYRVCEAAGGSEGISSMRENEIDLLIIDVMMPEKGGIETLMELHQTYPRLKTIVMSGFAPTEADSFKLLAERFGAARIFHKPMDRPLFLKAVSDLLAGS